MTLARKRVTVRAMEAAAHGQSTLGIPAEVGKEYVKKDKE